MVHALSKQEKGGYWSLMTVSRLSHVTLAGSVILYCPSSFSCLASFPLPLPFTLTVAFVNCSPRSLRKRGSEPFSAYFPFRESLFSQRMTGAAASSGEE